MNTNVDVENISNIFKDMIYQDISTADPYQSIAEANVLLSTLKTLMSTTEDILGFYWHLYNQLLKGKCAFNFETLIYFET